MVIAKRILEIQPLNRMLTKFAGVYARLKRYSEAEYEFNEALKNLRMILNAQRYAFIMPI